MAKNGEEAVNDEYGPLTLDTENRKILLPYPRQGDSNSGDEMMMPSVIYHLLIEASYKTYLESVCKCMMSKDKSMLGPAVLAMFQ